MWRYELWMNVMLNHVHRSIASIILASHSTCRVYIDRCKVRTRPTNRSGPLTASSRAYEPVYQCCRSLVMWRRARWRFDGRTRRLHAFTRYEDTPLLIVRQIPCPSFHDRRAAHVPAGIDRTAHIPAQTTVRFCWRWTELQLLVRCVHWNFRKTQ